MSLDEQPETGFGLFGPPTKKTVHPARYSADFSADLSADFSTNLSADFSADFFADFTSDLSSDFSTDSSHPNERNKPDDRTLQNGQSPKEQP